jgi:pre-mRNA-splicing factor CWC22
MEIETPSPAIRTVVESVVYRPVPVKRKRSESPPRSPPPRQRRMLPPSALPDVDPERALERERQLEERLAQQEKEQQEKKPFDPKEEYERLLNARSGGVYVPPARLRALQAQFTDKKTKEYQRMAWEALKKSINGLINKVNTSNIKMIVPELFGENLIRGRGLYCRSIMKAQAASLPFTPIYAALTAIINTKIPSIGELLLTRLIIQFRKAFRRNDKAVCLSSTTFIAHLCNQQVAHEIVALQILSLLLQNPTDDSVEVAVGFMRNIGAFLAEQSPKANTGVFERFRAVLHEGAIDKRVQYMIEVLFQVRKDGYKDNPIIPPELDLVEEDEVITHYLSLDDELDGQEGLGVFKFDENYEDNEEKYAQIKSEILGEGSDDSEADSDEEAEEAVEEKQQMEIQDETSTNLINLRRTIYLTIMSSVDFEECCHKLMRIDIQEGQEIELVNMIIECCSQERTFIKFYGLIGERFCNLNRNWQDTFEQAFDTYYTTIHRYETNRLRNIAKFFAFLIANDAIGWHVFSVIHLTEEETTSSSRIFIKILFQDLQEHLGLKKLVERLQDSYLQESFEGIFPRTNPKDIRFSINYFTSIGLGGVTEGMRNVLANMPKNPPPSAIKEEDSDSASVSSERSSRSSYSSRSGSYSGSYSGSESGSYSGSDSESESEEGRRRDSRDSPRARARPRSRTPSRSRSRSRTESRTPPKRRYSRSESRTPPRRRHS